MVKKHSTLLALLAGGSLHNAYCSCNALNNVASARLITPCHDVLLSESDRKSILVGLMDMIYLYYSQKRVVQDGGSFYLQTYEMSSL